jgi:hypothetical protein
MHRLGPALLAATILSGCAPTDAESGYAEIALNFVRTAGDIYRLNAAPLDELRGKGSAIIREPAGAARLELERTGRLYLLCNFAVRKNRIVTVSVFTGSGSFRCDVKD